MVVQRNSNLDSEPHGFIITESLHPFGELVNWAPDHHWTTGIMNGSDVLDDLPRRLICFGFQLPTREVVLNFGGIDRYRNSENLGTGYLRTSSPLPSLKRTDKVEFDLENNLVWHRQTTAEDSISYNSTPPLLPIQRLLGRLSDMNSSRSAARASPPPNTSTTRQQTDPPAAMVLYARRLPVPSRTAEFGPRCEQSFMIRPKSGRLGSRPWRRYNAGTKDHRFMFMFGGYFYISNRRRIHFQTKPAWDFSQGSSVSTCSWGGRFDELFLDLDAVLRQFMNEIDPGMVHDADAHGNGPRNVRGQSRRRAGIRSGHSRGDAFLEESAFGCERRSRRIGCWWKCRGHRQLILKLGLVQGIGIVSEDDLAMAPQSRHKIAHAGSV